MNYSLNYFLGFSLFILLFSLPVEEGERDTISADPQSHESWNSLLKKHVDDNGNVNYRDFLGDIGLLANYIKALGNNPPTDSASKEEKLVYYINLYNAATVKLILDNYPLKSIKDIKSPWGRKWIKVGENTISLNTIEHKIIRKLGEPRIHFAVNCASFSCPKLINKAFTLDNLEELLDSASKDFINDPTRNRITADSAEISEIFKWYTSDFTSNGTLIDYINQYRKVPIKAGTKLKYLKYDWSLNEMK